MTRQKTTNAELAEMPALTIKGNDHPTDPGRPKDLTVAELNAMGIGGISIPLLTADPESPITDLYMWFLRQTSPAEFDDGEAMGLGAMTYFGDVEQISPLRLRLSDNGTIREISIT